MKSMHSEWVRVQNVTNDKFYLLGSGLKELRRIQGQMASIQRDNAQTMIAQLQILKERVNLMRYCDQEFYIRGEINHNVAVSNSILSCLYSTFKVFRASLYTFRTNIFNVFAAIVNGFLPLCNSKISSA